MAEEGAALIGFIASVGISLLPFLADMPGQSKVDRTTVVRIGVGTSTNSGDSTGGNIPGLSIWDVEGRYISGSYGSDKNIDDGSYLDINLVAPEDVGGRQLQYMSVSAGGNDAICIAYVYATLPDNEKWTWLGDIGWQCGGPWYNSQTIEGGNGYQSKCLWIDGDGMSGTGSNGIWTQGFAMHMTDFIATGARTEAYRANNNRLMCQSWPRFHMYEKMTVNDCIPYFNPPLKYATDGTLLDADISKVMVAGSYATEGCNLDPQPDTDSSSTRRKSKDRRRNTQGSKFKGRLITSSHSAHSAIELCASDTSVGPDFVAHHEGMYCDMETKQAYPLCDSINVDSCFDATDNNLVPSNGPHRRDEVSVPTKDYHTVTHW